MTDWIIIPRLNANEDEVLLAEILVSEGQKVSRGDVLFVVETSKAAVPVESDVDGYVGAFRAAAGDRIKVGAPVCAVAKTADDLPAVEAATKTAGAGGKNRITAKQRLIARRAADGKKTRPATQAVAPPVITPSEALPWVISARAAVAELMEPADGGGTEWTGPRAPVAEDKEANACFGEGCEIGDGTRITARRLYLAPGAKVGSDCRIEGGDVYIGANASLGDGLTMVSGEIVIGVGTVIGRQVEVDVAGGMAEDSRFLVGEACLIATGSLINACREVVLESETALSPGVMVFTHAFWQSVLEGYPARFEGVRLCPGAWVGAGCQILPGSVIGPGAVVMSNSTVTGIIPEGCLAGGVPAEVIRKKAARPMSSADETSAMQDILSAFTRRLKFKGCEIHTSEDGLNMDVVLPDGGESRISVLTMDDNPDELPTGSIVVSLVDAVRCPKGGVLFDIPGRRFEGTWSPLVYELRNYFRRHGIRFEPHGWSTDYRQGL